MTGIPHHRHRLGRPFATPSPVRLRIHLSWQTTSGRYTSTPFQAAIAETATNGLVTASNPMALASVGPAVTIGDALNTEAK